MSTDAAAGFIACELVLPLPLSHGYHGKALDGAQKVLDDMLMKYNSEINGVLIAYGKLRPASGAAADVEGYNYTTSHGGEPICRIVDELPLMHAKMACEAVLFAPQLGDILKGVVHSVGSGHISLLVGGLFNAAILKEDLLGAFSYSESDRRWLSSDSTVSLAATISTATNSSSGSKRKRSSETSIQLGPPSGSPIEDGTEVTFVVKGVSNASGVMAIHGTLDGKFAKGAIKQAEQHIAVDEEDTEKAPRHKKSRKDSEQVDDGEVRSKRSRKESEHIDEAEGSKAARHKKSRKESEQIDDEDVEAEKPRKKASKHKHG